MRTDLRDADLVKNFLSLPLTFLLLAGNIALRLLKLHPGLGLLFLDYLNQLKYIGIIGFPMIFLNCEYKPSTWLFVLGRVVEVVPVMRLLNAPFI